MMTILVEDRLTVCVAQNAGNVITPQTCTASARDRDISLIQPVFIDDLDEAGIGGKWRRLVHVLVGEVTTRSDHAVFGRERSLDISNPEPELWSRE